MNAAVLTLAAATDGLREWQSQLLWAGPILAVVILVLALVIAWFKKQRSAGDEALLPREQLAHFEQLHWKGELSKEEFERIQKLLGERMREAPGDHPEKPGHSPEPPQPPETGIRPQPPS